MAQGMGTQKIFLWWEPGFPKARSYGPGPTLWTILDVSIKNAPSLNSFKFKLKKYFLRNYQALALSL